MQQLSDDLLRQLSGCTIHSQRSLPTCRPASQGISLMLQKHFADLVQMQKEDQEVETARIQR